MNLNIFALGKNEGEAFWFLNHLALVKASAEQTANAFGLVEFYAAVGDGSPYHVHRAEDETFYVLEGELEFFSGERRMIGGAGSLVFLPRDIPHGFRVVGASAARFFVLCTPGGFEGFVMELGQPAESLTLPVPSPPDMEKLGALAAKYRIELLGPLPE